MNRFKKILLSLHGEKKDNLGKIYQDKQVYISSVRSSAQPVEEARIFSYGNLSCPMEVWQRSFLPRVPAAACHRRRVLLRPFMRGAGYC